MNWRRFMSKQTKIFIAVIIGVLVFTVLLFVPIKSRTFNSIVENKYDFFNRGALTVDYNYGKLTYEKDVFLPYKIYDSYNIGDSYNLTIKTSILTSIPENYIFTAAIASVILVPIILLFNGMKLNRKKTESTK